MESHVFRLGFEDGISQNSHLPGEHGGKLPGKRQAVLNFLGRAEHHYIFEEKEIGML